MTLTVYCESHSRQKSLPDAGLTPTTWLIRPRECYDVGFARAQKIEKINCSITQFA
jgi:hypothetical protein